MVVAVFSLDKKMPFSDFLLLSVCHQNTDKNVVVTDAINRVMIEI